MNISWLHAAASLGLAYLGMLGLCLGLPYVAMAVCRQAKEELGINVFGFSCEGYKGVSQSAGHSLAWLSTARCRLCQLGCNHSCRPVGVQQSA